MVEEVLFLISFYNVCFLSAIEWIYVFINPRMLTGLTGSEAILSRLKKLIISIQAIMIIIYFILYIFNPIGFTDIFVPNLIFLCKSIVLLLVYPICSYIYLIYKIRNDSLNILIQMTQEKGNKPRFKYFRDEIIFGYNYSIAVTDLKKVYDKYTSKMDRNGREWLGLQAINTAIFGFKKGSAYTS